ncbi:fumarylacetoacetate hydrolase family protein [Occultella gossypii]|uniref:Fumarylacetoacetate hydrolase family protein n=1 Tax=Occultella gossypii TaxID=2800820 RepID=A0ABS7SFD9_9MICO|nr:fumarylacetoacetate hydrolase family protein [Occultella gossypii]MBZ2198613.1 fumarylacetoacetate hydrolase family protein [Occultella gossypii]
MQIARFTTGDDPHYALVEGSDLVVLTGDPLYTPLTPTGQRVPIETTRLLAPVIPRSKVVAFGRNYAEHAAELGNEVPELPLVFVKPNTTVVGPDDPIVLPSYSQDVHHEAELAVVISRICKDLPAERANEVILGYTAANDVTARDVQRTDKTWTRGKMFDTSCPLGPVLVTDLDVSDLRIQARVDGELRQDGSTAQMIHSVPELIAYASTLFTLLPGDVILTGTPAGVGPILEGQRVEVEIEGIGILGNPVVRR